MRLEESWVQLEMPNFYCTGLLQPLLWGVMEEDLPKN